MMDHQVAGRFKIVVFSCGDLGFEVASKLQQLPGTELTLVTTPYRTKQLTFLGKIKQIHRMQGYWGLVSVVAHKITAGFRRRKDGGVSPQPASSDVPHFHFEDFHQAECLEKLAELKPDLGVIAGTYILKESVFSVPRLGSINLHSGKVPEYRGAAPAFWELYNGESEVGVTIHRVAAEVDAGVVLSQETFPLDSAPSEDPLAYIERYRREILRPNGVRMLVGTVRQMIDGTVAERLQDLSKAKTYKTPDYAAVRELRRRVRQRRELKTA